MRSAEPGMEPAPGCERSDLGGCGVGWQSLRAEDRLWMLEVFYAGGTAKRDFSAADIVAEISARGRRAAFASGRDELANALATEARPGDLILVVGARDPSLTELARAIVA